MARSRTITGGVFPTFVTGDRNGRVSLPGVFLTGTIEAPPVGAHRGLLMSMLGLTFKQVAGTPPAGTGLFTVNWGASLTAGVTGYNLYRTTGGLTGPWTFDGNVGAGTTTYQFQNLANGTPYWFKVVPVISGVEGSEAGIIDGTPL